MSTINNFDQSSSGDNITVNLCYDVDVAQYEFRENFKTVQSESYRKTAIYYYVDNGNIPDHDALEWNVLGTVKQLREYMKKECDLVNIAGMNKEQLQNEVLESLAVDHYLKLEEKADIDAILEPYGLEFDCGAKLEKVAIRGYSQGDYAEIYVNVDALREVWGSEPDLNELRDTFRHYFYDQPIYGVIEINGEEFPYEHDRYEFQRAEWLENITRDLKPSQDHIKEWLLENVPESVPYN